MNPGDQDLLGYLLGALEPHEQVGVERALESDPELRIRMSELADSLAPIDDLGDSAPVPPGLARRTCEAIANQVAHHQTPTNHLQRERPLEKVAESVRAATGPLSSENSVGPAKSPNRNKRSNRNSETRPTARLSRVTDFIYANSLSAREMTVTAAACLVLGMLFFPAVANSRHQARVSACQNNLRQVGLGLTEYGELHGGYFPAVSKKGALSGAGSCVSRLRDGGFIECEQIVVCPSSPIADQWEAFSIPSHDELAAMSGSEAAYWKQRMGGSYAYPLGTIAANHVVPHRNRFRANFVILADAPDLTANGWTSRNHSGHGQNVVCEDMSIRYVRDCRLFPCEQSATGDLFYANRNGQVAPGVDIDDSVVAPGEVCPIPTTGLLSE